MTAENLEKPFLIVRHQELERVSEGSPFRSFCPVCSKGVLLVRRHDVFDTTDPKIAMGLSKIDNCSMCAQRFVYEENEIAGEPLTFPEKMNAWPHVKQPETLTEAIATLHALLVDEDRSFLRESKDSEGAASELHHSLGRHIRNSWGLWQNSKLFQHIRDEHGIEHPDDVSHLIIATYARRGHVKPKTAWERIAEDEDESSG